jgi:large subunit ribosomal protein L22
MKVSAKLKNLRIAPRKVRLTSDLIKGMDVQAAMSQLEVIVKRSNPYFAKLLASAISNGENNFGLDKDNLYISDIIVDAGSTLKRSRPRAFGRAGAIMKRTSKIEIILEERVEGKNRKSQAEMEKEKKQRLAERNKEEKKEAEAKKEEVKTEKPKAKLTDATEKSKKVEKKGGLTSRIFQRKSM